MLNHQHLYPRKLPAIIIYCSLIMIPPLQEEYVCQLQSQIEDLERYITFLQDAHPSKPTSPITPPQGSGLPLPRSRDIDTGIHVPHHRSRDSKSSKKKSHDNTTKSRDRRHYPQHDDMKRVTFAESAHNGEVTPTTPIEMIGPFLRHGNQAVPEYRLALTQLDGVDCAMDASRSEWVQEGSLGEPLQGSKVGTDLLNSTMTPSVGVKGGLVSLTPLYTRPGF